MSDFDLILNLKYIVIPQLALGRNVGKGGLPLITAIKL